MSLEPPELRERHENRTGAGFCPVCLVGIELHPLDEHDDDVAHCPSARTALDLEWARRDAASPPMGVEQLAAILHETSPDCRLIPSNRENGPAHRAGDRHWATVLLARLAPAEPAGLDVERLREAAMTVESGYILKPDRTARAYWQKVAAAYARLPRPT